jgi:CBS domain containing-hemolysin-like protein
MSEDLADALRIGTVLLLVLVNSWFVAAEFAFVSVRRTRVEELVRKGNRAAGWVKRAILDMDGVVATAQLGITLSSLALGWIGEPALGRLLQPLVDLFPATLESEVSHGLSAGLAFGLITFLHMVVGELAPKTIALQNAEKVALIVAQPTIIVQWIFKPALWVLNGSGNLLLRVLGVRPAPDHARVHSVEELKMLVSASAASGVVEDDEQQMLHAVFEFGETLVRQVMIPRTELVAVPYDADLQSLLDTAVDNSYSKMPVFEGDIDHVVGVVHLKDIMSALKEEDQDKQNAKSVMRETVFIPDAARVSTLLQIFRAHHRHLAIVLDEYGGTAGVVTLEDLLEEIFGEVSDPFDRGPDIQPQPDGSSLVDGLTSIEQVNEQFDLRLQDPYYDTVAGFIIGKLGRLARVGDTVHSDGVRLRVVAMDGKRIARVWIYPIPSEVDLETSKA